MSEAVAGDPADLDRIADALEGATDRLHERNQAIGEIQTAVTALCLSTDALVIAVKGNTQRNRQFRWTMVAIGVLAIVGIAAAIVVGATNHSLAKKITSCTTPPTAADQGGKCYRDGQARTAAAVATLEIQFERDVAAAILCARVTGDFNRVLACVHAAAAGTP